MEELLAMLLQQAAERRIVESDAKHGALIQQLRMARAPQTSEAEGWERYLAQQGDPRRQVAATMRPSPQGGMPILNRADTLNRAVNANDIAALRERGETIPPHLYAGLSPDEVALAHKMGSEMQAYGGEPSLQVMPQPDRAPAVVAKPYTGETMAQEDERLADQKTKKRMLLGEKVNLERRAGMMDPESFEGLTQMDAARRIADMLHAERARAGDPTAWWTALSTGI